MDINIINWLKDNGWKISTSTFNREQYKTTFYKQFRDVRPSCYCNNRGVQICLNHYKFPTDTNGYTHETVEIDLVAECKDGQWVKLSVYSISVNELMDILDVQCEKLIEAWKAGNKST